MKSTLTIIITAGILAGCAAPARQTFTFPPYDEAEYASLPKTGTAVIRGQVFAKTVGGDVKRGAGESVSLIPATRYGETLYREQIMGGKRASKPEDPRHFNHTISLTTDGDGRFEFKNIPRGSYYISSRVVWSVPVYDRYIGTIMEPQGGRVTRKVEADDGKVTEVILNYN